MTSSPGRIFLIFFSVALFSGAKGRAFNISVLVVEVVVPADTVERVVSICRETSFITESAMFFILTFRSNAVPGRTSAGIVSTDAIPRFASTVSTSISYSCVVQPSFPTLYLNLIVFAPSTALSSILTLYLTMKPVSLCCKLSREFI